MTGTQFLLNDFINAHSHINEVNNLFIVIIILMRNFQNLVRLRKSEKEIMMIANNMYLICDQNVGQYVESMKKRD